MKHQQAYAANDASRWIRSREFDFKLSDGNGDLSEINIILICFVFLQIVQRTEQGGEEYLAVI